MVSCWSEPFDTFGTHHYPRAALSPDPRTLGASYWDVGTWGYTNYNVSYGENYWGYDIIGYGEELSSGYSESGISLPCGAVVYQGLEITCRCGDINYTQYGSGGVNRLTEEIGYPSNPYDQNCRYEFDDTHSACQNEAN